MGTTKERHTTAREESTQKPSTHTKTTKLLKAMKSNSNAGVSTPVHTHAKRTARKPRIVSQTLLILTLSFSFWPVGDTFQSLNSLSTSQTLAEIDKWENTTLITDMRETVNSARTKRSLAQTTLQPREQRDPTIERSKNTQHMRHDMKRSNRSLTRTEVHTQGDGLAGNRREGGRSVNLRSEKFDRNNLTTQTLRHTVPPEALTSVTQGPRVAAGAGQENTEVSLPSQPLDILVHPEHVRNTQSLTYGKNRGDAAEIFKKQWMNAKVTYVPKANGEIQAKLNVGEPDQIMTHRSRLQETKKLGGYTVDETANSRMYTHNMSNTDVTPGQTCMTLVGALQLTPAAEHVRQNRSRTYGENRGDAAEIFTAEQKETQVT